jgi:hypothetical protein
VGSWREPHGRRLSVARSADGAAAGLIKIKGHCDEMFQQWDMAAGTQADFNCPHCDAGYKLVRVEAESGKTYRPVRCKVCRGALPATDGGEVLKYFLVRRPRNRRA